MASGSANLPPMVSIVHHSRPSPSPETSPSGRQSAPHLSPPGRSRNAVAQARHRAKRKAYIEQLEETVSRLQRALSAPETRGYQPYAHSNHVVAPPGSYADPRQHAAALYPEPGFDADGRVMFVRMKALELEVESLRQWADHAKSLLDQKNIQIPPIPLSSFPEQDSRILGGIQVREGRLMISPGNANASLSGAKRRRSLSNGPLRYPGQENGLSVGTPSDNNGLVSDPPTASGIALSSRQLPPVPAQRMNRDYNFAVPESQRQSSSITEHTSSTAAQLHTTPEQSPARWTAMPGGVGGGGGGVPLSQGLNNTFHPSHHGPAQRAPNGTHIDSSPARGGDRYYANDTTTSQPSTPASLASMPPPHPQASPTTLNAGGHGLHLPPPGPRTSYSGQQQDAFANNAGHGGTRNDGTGFIGRTYTAYGNNAAAEDATRRRFTNSASVALKAEVPDDHVPRSNTVSSQNGSGGQAQAQAAQHGGTIDVDSVHSPVTSAGIDGSDIRRHYSAHYNNSPDGSTNGPFTRLVSEQHPHQHPHPHPHPHSHSHSHPHSETNPAQATTTNTTNTAPPHSPYTPTSADSVTFRHPIPPPISASNAYGDLSRWSSNGYGH